MLDVVNRGCYPSRYGDYCQTNGDTTTCVCSTGEVRFGLDNYDILYTTRGKRVSIQRTKSSTSGQQWSVLIPAGANEAGCDWKGTQRPRLRSQCLNKQLFMYDCYSNKIDRSMDILESHILRKYTIIDRKRKRESPDVTPSSSVTWPYTGSCYRWFDLHVFRTALPFLSSDSSNTTDAKIISVTFLRIVLPGMTDVQVHCSYLLCQSILVL